MQNVFDTVEEFWSKTDVMQAHERAGKHSIDAFIMKISSYWGLQKVA